MGVGRGDLEEAVLGHGLAQGRHDAAAEDDVLLDGGVSQVEITVFEALGLIGLTAAVDLKGQLVIAAAAEDFDLLGHDLNVAGGQLGVLAVALTDDALDGDGGLLVETLDDAHHLFVFDDDLGGAVEITQDDEGEVVADLADILHPADDFDLLTDMLHAELVAGMGAGLCHDYQFLFMLCVRHVGAIHESPGGTAHVIRMRPGGHEKHRLCCRAVHERPLHL